MTATRKRLPRRAISPIDVAKRATVEADTAKAITSTDLGGGGKLAPAGNEILPPAKLALDEDEKKRRKSVVKATTADLVSLHAALHREFIEKGADREGAVNLHARVVDELATRNVAHPAPPNDTLDDTSTDFEATAVAKAATLQRLDVTKEVVEKREDVADVDPYLDIPSGPQPFTVHHRWIGKSVRSEFRAKAGEVALCWLLDTEIAKTNVPVTTLKLARAIPLDAVSAINWGSGEWKTEPVAKAAEPTPLAWLDVEAATVPGMFSDEAGVVQIVEKGVVEFGAQFDGFHEYFPQGRAFNYPVIFKREGDAFRASHPDDFTPFVLTKEAVEKGWLPPEGVSALPVAVEKQIAEDRRYWLEEDVEVAKAARDVLVAEIEKGKVEIDFVAPFKKEIRKASMNHSRFAIHKAQTGIVTKTLLRLDMGHEEIVSLEMDGDPTRSSTVVFKSEPHREALDFEGVASRGHFLNPAKGQITKIEKLDGGSARVTKLEENELQVELDGHDLKGAFVLKDIGGGDWLWEPAQIETDVEKIFVPILKAEKREVTGIVLEPETVDAHKDIVSEEVIKKAAHRFMANFNKTTKLGLMHTVFGEIGVELVESYIAKTAEKIGSRKVKKGSWIMVVKIVNDQLWKKIKAGKITGFSIGGIATVAG